MAVAVKNTPGASTSSPLDRLGIAGLAGAVYVVAAVAIAFYGIPTLWWKVWDAGLKHGSPVGWALLCLVVLAAIGGLIYAGGRLAQAHPVHGLSASVFCALVGLLFVLLITCGLGSTFEGWFGSNPAVGAALTLVVAAVLLGALGWLFLDSRFERAMVALDEQGWFTSTPYKKSQGQRVRRGTILGILVLAGCGIYTLLNHGTLNAAKDWIVVLPFTSGRYVPLLPDMRFTVPLVLAALSLWLAYRVVNLPMFADFLIATEAELNKVSWTTRRRLIQDTAVVLVTVLLLTLFLFLVDQGWAWALTRVGVLQAPTNQTPTTQKEQPW
jgi:preprotein translocase SecE subunit